MLAPYTELLLAPYTARVQVVGYIPYLPNDSRPSTPSALRARRRLALAINVVAAIQSIATGGRSKSREKDNLNGRSRSRSVQRTPAASRPQSAVSSSQPPAPMLGRDLEPPLQKSNET